VDENNPFRDWLRSKPYAGTWVPVGSLRGWGGPASVPVLFPAGEKDKILASTDWPLRIDEPRPEVWEYPDGKREAYLRPERDRQGVPLEALSVYFRPPDRRSWLEPLQAFVLHLGASPRHQGAGRISWEIPDEDGKPEEIARWVPVEEPEPGGVLEIRRDVLLHFMRDFDFDLAIFYEESRATADVPDGWRDEEREDLRHWRAWAVDVGEEVRAMVRCGTVLLRPDTLRSDPEAIARGQTLEYVIGLHPVTGEPIRESYPGEPHERTAWEGAGNDNFLTPVFFRREVLDYYLDDPKHYDVSPVQVQAGGMWSIPIAITDRGNVQVWLGDLGRISDRAQRHWQQYNIPDDDDVPDWRRRRDLNAEWVETPRDSAVDRVRQAIEDCNEAAVGYCGEPLYADIKGMNAQRLKTLRTPLNSSLPAFQYHVTTLAILVVDHLSSEFFAGVAAPKGSSSLNRLAEWLESACQLDRGAARDLIGGLYAVQAVRSEAGAAHRAGETAGAVLERAGIDPEDLPAGFERLALGVVAALETVRQKISELPPRVPGIS
jgi:hypothetical protein